MIGLNSEVVLYFFYIFTVNASSLSSIFLKVWHPENVYLSHLAVEVKRVSSINTFVCNVRVEENVKDG